jgi:hypothetical protein
MKLNRRQSIFLGLFGLAGCAGDPSAPAQSEDKPIDVCPNGHAQTPIYLGESGEYQVFTCSRCNVMYVSDYKVSEQ